MTSCDTNILFHAACPRSPLHDKARGFLASHASDRDFSLCELSLVEFYGLLRNPTLLERPLSPAEAVELIQGYRRNRFWRILDYPGNLMNDLWQRAAQKGFARHRIYDARLALTLRHHGVEDFATRNMADFEGFGFARLWDPLEAT
ncbi:MAG: VapC toxin family PIN domain ribonuclease [Lentisphaerae bacterium]|nr:VapC toxin family PIN domain ribonuclease [Lentisphaerota bacterium]